MCERDLSVDDFYELIDPSELRDVRRHVEERGLSGIQALVASKQKEWQFVPLTVAVVGEAAVGKSTFINSVRGLTAEDEGAAPVGTGDMTKNPTMYPHPFNPQLVFWDLPGVGTPRFPKDQSYLGRVQYSKYDFFLLLSDERFSVNDVWLAQEIEKMNKTYFFVRTKIDQSMDSARQSEKDFSVNVILDRIRSKCEENFKAARLCQKTVYFISNYEREEWDFNQLLEDILVSLPEQKRNALVLSLSPISKSVIKSKSAALRRRATVVASMSGAQAAVSSLVPVPLLGGAITVSLDLMLLVEEVNFFLKQYGLDDESLNELSKRTSTKIDYYKNALQNGSALVTSRQAAKSYVLNLLKSEFTEAACKRASVEATRFVPVLGAIIGGGTSFFTALYLLHNIISTLERDALTLIDAIIHLTSTQV